MSVRELEANDVIDFDEFMSNTQRKKLERQKRKEQRKQIQQTKSVTNSTISLKPISPLTANQAKVFEYYNLDKHLLLHGLPGTGKTFLAMYLALNDVLINHKYEKVCIVRSAVPTRQIGFLPGKANEKVNVYEIPYKVICSKLFGKATAYDNLKNKQQLEFMSTSFIRGLTIEDTIVIIDECENLNMHELDSVITRLGDNTKIIICGDLEQSDFIWNDERAGLSTFMKILDRMESFKTVNFDKEEDIVRSGIVREYIIAKHRLKNIQ